MHSIQNKKGFTVVEMLVVIGIIGVLAAMATLGIDVIRRERLNSATRALMADLQLARGRSLTSVATIARPNLRGFGVNFTSATSYSTFTFEDSQPAPLGNFQFDDPAEALNPRPTNLPTPMQMVINGAVPANTVVIFDRFGIPRDENWGLGNMTIVLSQQNQLPKCIVVSEARIREGMWDGADCVQQ